MYDFYSREDEPDEDEQTLTEVEFAMFLQEVVDKAIGHPEDVDSSIDVDELEEATTENYAGGTWMTRDSGFVVHLRDGRQFHVVVKEQ